MKKLILSAAVAMTSLFLLTGCIALSLGGGQSHETKSPTIGQQLIDLQKAKDSGAITEAEFQTQKSRLLDTK